MSANRYFFLHIPKTAGSSLHRVLRKHAGPYLHQRFPHELAWPSSTIWERFRGCGGHANWHAAEKLGLLRGFTITFLRDPIERILSQYSFAQFGGHGNMPDAVLARRFDLNEVLRHSAGRLGSFWNAQTYFLSGLDPTEVEPERHLASALANLEKFDFVGTTETFAEDCQALMQALENKTTSSLPFENRTIARLERDNLGPETLSLLEESQALDRLLYSRARELQQRRKPLALAPDPTPLVGWPPPRETFGTDAVKFNRIEIREIHGGPLLPGAEAELQVFWSAREQIAELNLGVAISDAVGNYIAGTNTALIANRTLSAPAGDARGLFRFKLTMGAGRYCVSVALQHDGRDLCRSNFAATFEVEMPVAPYREGMTDLVAKAEVQSIPSSPAFSEDEAAKISLQFLGPPQPDPQHGHLRIPVEVSNLGARTLSSTAPCRIFASYHWKSMDDSVVLWDGWRSPLPQDLWPSEKAPLSILVLPPPAPGRWRLQVRLVQEDVRWHEGAGFEKSMPPNLMFVRHENGRCDLASEDGSAAEV